MTHIDVLAELAQVPEVRALCDQTRDLLDEVAWDRALRRADADFWTGVRRWCGYASASLDGATMPRDALVEPDASAMGRLSLAGLMVTAAADDDTQLRAPMQLWAHLHSVADGGPERGRPRTDEMVVDPLHLGAVPPSSIVADRLADLSTSVAGSRAPGVLVAALCHAELATVRPFRNHSYLVARATPRVVLRAAGLDLPGAAALEAGMAAVGRPRYVAALRAYQAGEMPEYLAFFRDSVQAGIAQTRFLHRNGGFTNEVV